MKRLLYLLVLSAAAASAQTAVWPGAVVSDNQLLVLANLCTSRISSSIPDSVTTTIFVANASLSPTCFLINQEVQVDNEFMKITSVGFGQLTVIRGFDNSTASTHNNNAPITNVPAAWYHNALAKEVESIESWLANGGGGGGGGGTPGGALGSSQYNSQGKFAGFPPLNVLGAGITANGNTDDTAIWNSTFSSVLATGGIVTFPSNTGACSKISTPIVIGNGTTPLNIEFFGQSTVAQENAPGTASCILQGNPGQDIVDLTYGGRDNFTMRGVVLKYAQTPPSGTASVTGNTLVPVVGSVNGSWYVPGGHGSVYVQGSSIWSTPCSGSVCTITSTTAGSSYVNPQLITDDGYISSGLSAAINQSSYSVLNWQLSAITSGGSPLTTAPVANGVLALTGSSTWSLVNVTSANSAFTTGTGLPTTFHSLPVTSTAGHALIIVAASFQAGTTGATYSSMTANSGDTVVQCPLNILSGASVYNTTPLAANTGQIMCGYVASTVGGTNVTFNVSTTTASGKEVGASVYVLEYSAGTVTYDTSNAVSSATCSTTACAAPSISPSGSNDLYLQMMATGQGDLVNALGFGPPGSMTISGNCTSGCPTSGSPTEWSVGVGLHTIGTNFQVGTSISYVTVANAGVGISNDANSVSPSFEHMSYFNNYIGHNDGGSQQALIADAIFQGGFIGWNSESGLVEGPEFRRLVAEAQSGPQFRTSTQVTTPHFIDIWHEFPGSDMYQVYWLGSGGTASPGWITGTWSGCRFNASSIGSGNVFNIVDPGLASSAKSQLTLLGGFVVNLPTPFNLTAINGSSHSASDPTTSANPGYTALHIVGTQVPVSYQIGGLYTLTQALTSYLIDVPSFVSTQIPANFHSSVVPTYLSLGQKGVGVSGSPLATTLLAGAPTYTAGTNVTSVSCNIGSCTNTRGEIHIVGGTATTGTIATINFNGLIVAPAACIVSENPDGVHQISHGTPSSSSMIIAAAVSVASTDVFVDWYCQP